MKLSIIIPVAPREDRLAELLSELPGDCEIIVVSTEPLELSGVINVVSEQGRAVQLNKGAKCAKGDFFWFLHADARLLSDSLERLKESLEKSPDSLHYFDLRFYDNGAKMWLNNVGVWFRSHILGVPFGDQGFCVSKKNFDRLGRFDEEAEYGEDHLFVWKARQAGVKLQCVGDYIYTSARKYKEGGWLRTMVKYQYMWIKQAIPEFMKYLLSS